MKGNPVRAGYVEQTSMGFPPPPTTNEQRMLCEELIERLFSWHKFNDPDAQVLLEIFEQERDG